MLMHILGAGLKSLQEYILLHTVTCLIPAFLLAGAMTSFVSKENVLYYLGAHASRLRSFVLAAAGSFLIAVCSCTIIPVASGLYYQGAGIGASFIFLWVAPAANILALVYTGSILGAKMALLRIALALSMALIVGTAMTMLFLRDEKKRIAEIQKRAAATNGGAPVKALIEKKFILLLALLVATLLAPNYISQKGPYLQKVLIWGIATAITALYVARTISKEEIMRWLSETWWFVRIIFPLLLVGVFIVGIIGAILPEAWVRQWLSGSSIRSSFLATLLGTTSYFATLTEAPFVDTLVKLGMGKGAALALLLTGPGVSLPNLLVIARIFGPKKALAYFVIIVCLGTFGGFLVGKLFF
jgi:uncharacterized membrane protein YraQ (UPF0718 family)